MYHYDSNGNKVLRENFVPQRNGPPPQRMRFRENYDGSSKPIYKKIWFWLVIVLVLVAVGVGIMYWKQSSGKSSSSPVRDNIPASFGFRFY